MQNYKIYINKIVVLLIEHKKSFHNENKAETVIYYCKKKEELEKIITAVEIGSISTNLIIMADDLDWLKKEFFDAFKIIEAGGGLVQNQNGKYLMMFRKGKWDIPKGKIDKGEEIKAGALREVEEETGVQNLKINYKLGKTYHTYKLKDKWVLKETHWYAMRTDYDGELVPEESEGIEKVVWASKKEIKSMLKNSYASIKEVFKMK